MSHGTVVIPEKVHSIAMEQRWGRSIWVDKTSVGWRSKGGKYLYQEGLVSARGWRGPLLFISIAQPWQNVETMRHDRWIMLQYDREHGSVITFKSDRFDVTFSDGGSVRFYAGRVPDRTLASDYFRYGVREDGEELNETAARAVATVEDKVTDALVPRLRRELEAGNRVDFGALSATLNEVTYGQDVFGWNDIGTLKLSTPWPSDDDLRKHYVSRSDATLRLTWKTPDGQQGSARLTTDEVWNVKALQELHRILARPGQ